MNFIVMLICMLIPFVGHGQTASSEDISSTKKNTLGISYYGDLSFNEKSFKINPGLEVNYAWQILGKSYHKGNSYSNSYKDRQMFLKPFFNFYIRQHYQTGVGLGADLSYRSTSAKGLFWDVAIGGGYLHTFYNDPVYEQVNDSTFKQIRFQGNPNVMIRGNLHVGYDCSKKYQGIPVAFFIGGGTFLRYPQAHAWVIRQYIDAGVNIILSKKSK